MLIRGHLQINVTALHTGAAVQFAHDPVLTASLRARFPAARWGAQTRSWHIPGKLAAIRAQKWADEQTPYLAAAEQRLRDAEWASPVAPSPAPAGEPLPPGVARARAWHAIPGQPSKRTLGPPPEGDIDRIMREIADLNARIQYGVLWAFMSGPSVSVSLGDPPGMSCNLQDGTWQGLYTYHRSPAGQTSGVTWRWTGMTGGEGWQVDGWMPCPRHYRAWALAAVFRVLNPHLDLVRSFPTFFSAPRAAAVQP